MIVERPGALAGRHDGQIVAELLRADAPGDVADLRGEFLRGVLSAKFVPCPTLRNSTSATLRIGFGMAGPFRCGSVRGTGPRRFPKTTLIPACRSS
jgi:hypothetical protein